MRLKILTSLPERDKKSVRLCCRQLKSDIDTHVGLSVLFFEPIRNFDKLDWMTNYVRINQVILSETLQTSEMVVLLQTFSKVKTVRIWQPQKHIDLIPLLTTVSSLEDLRHLSLVHELNRFVHRQIICSYYRFSNLRVLDLKIFQFSFIEDSFWSANILCLMRCPQLQDLKLSLTFESESIRFNNTYQWERECLLSSEWLVHMIETFPSIRSLDLDVEFILYTTFPYYYHYHNHILDQVSRTNVLLTYAFR